MKRTETHIEFWSLEAHTNTPPTIGLHWHDPVVSVTRHCMGSIMLHTRNGSSNVRLTLTADEARDIATALVEKANEADAERAKFD